MTAVCTDPQFQWLSNSRGQSPCEIASQLAGACNTGSGGVPGMLGPGTQYPPLSAQDANPCTCNTVRYSIIVACSACQSRSYLTFPQYTTACKQTYNQQFPAAIPGSTSIPHFYFDPLGNGQFNWTLAQNSQNFPESSASPGPTTSNQQNTPSATNNPPQTTQTPSTQGQGTTSQTPVISTISANGTTTIVTFGSVQPTTVDQPGSAQTPQSGTANTSSGSSKVGPIVGGVVGGIAIICIFLAFLWWLRQRERRIQEEQARLAPSPLMAGHGGGESVDPPPYMPSDVASIGSVNAPIFNTKSTQMNMQSMNTHTGSGYQPVSDGGSSAALTGFGSTVTIPKSGSSQV